MKITLSMIALVLMLLSSRLTAQESTSIPQQVIDDWAYFIGDWKIDGQVGSASVTGTATYRWSNGKQSYFGEQVWKIEQTENDIYLSLIGGWDSEKNQTVEQGFDSTGGLATTRYEIQQSNEYPASKSGMIDGFSRRGGAWSGKANIERFSPDKFQITTHVDGARFHVLTFRKRTPPSGE